ncbi:hypothetical protein LTR08_007102 [Meristemomyces frigidus]|nr:hypothetical protein LTR08_007102 [Meristemomyces frigidus]
MIELGLQRISRLLARTPLPWRAIHVAGTNGKGSICHYISAMLEVYNKSEYRKERGQTALKHARFTSPHLIDRWDCITVDQQTVSSKLFDHMNSKVLRRNEQESIRATEFELLTATAFEIFTHEQVDVGVVEVGMGGRLDATNIIGQPGVPEPLDGIDPVTFRPLPLVTAISRLGLDHQAFLGNTYAAIAGEKAGIMKPNVPVVWDTEMDGSAVEVLEIKAIDNRVVGVNGPYLPGAFSLDRRPLSSLLDRRAPRNKSRPPHHQILNLSVAFRSTWTALQRLERLPARCDNLTTQDTDVLTVLAENMLLEPAYTEAILPGRLQTLDISALVGDERHVLLDGAHNVQSAKMLGRHLKHSGTHRKWVLAASDTKDTKTLLAPILRHGDTVFAVEFGPVAGMPWVHPMAAEKLAEAAKSVANVKVEVYGRDILSALTAASEKVSPKHMMIVAGSLYLVGDVLRLLRDRKGLAKNAPDTSPQT